MSCKIIFREYSVHNHSFKIFLKNALRICFTTTSILWFIFTVRESNSFILSGTLNVTHLMIPASRPHGAKVVSLFQLHMFFSLDQNINNILRYIYRSLTKLPKRNFSVVCACLSTGVGPRLSFMHWVSQFVDPIDLCPETLPLGFNLLTPGDETYTIGKRSIGILLECFLVSFCFPLNISLSNVEKPMIHWTSLCRTPLPRHVQTYTTWTTLQRPPSRTVPWTEALPPDITFLLDMKHIRLTSGWLISY